MSKRLIPWNDADRVIAVSMSKQLMEVGKAALAYDVNRWVRLYDESTPAPTTSNGEGL